MERALARAKELDEYLFAIMPDFVDALVSSETERNLSVREKRAQHLLDARLARDREAVHVRPRDYPHA